MSLIKRKGRCPGCGLLDCTHPMYDLDGNGFRRGATAAAGVAGDYTTSSSHPYRLDDCVLSKLNLRSARPRKNPRPLAHVSKRDVARWRHKARAMFDEEPRSKAEWRAALDLGRDILKVLGWESPRRRSK